MLKAYIETYLQNSTRFPSRYSLSSNFELNLEYTSRNTPVLNSLAPPLFNGTHTLIIQCLSMIDCLIRVDGLFVLNNNLC